MRNLMDPAGQRRILCDTDVVAGLDHKPGVRPLAGGLAADAGERAVAGRSGPPRPTRREVAAAVSRRIEAPARPALTPLARRAGAPG